MWFQLSSYTLYYTVIKLFSYYVQPKADSNKLRYSYSWDVVVWLSQCEDDTSGVRRHDSTTALFKDVS